MISIDEKGDASNFGETTEEDSELDEWVKFDETEEGHWSDKEKLKVLEGIMDIDDTEEMWKNC